MRCFKLIAKSFILLALFLSYGCEKQDDGSYVPPYSVTEMIRGTWKLSTIKEIDEIAVTAGAKAKDSELSLTSKFKFSTFVITLNADSVKEFVPTTFKVEGESPSLFLKEGYWDLDQDYLKSDGMGNTIRLYSDAAKTNLVDELYLTKLPQGVNSMSFKFSRKTSDNTVFLSYLYEVKK